MIRRQRQPEVVSEQKNLGITPFGVICLECNTAIGNGDDGNKLANSIRLHYTRKKHTLKGNLSYKDLSKILKQLIASRFSGLKDFSPWIKDDSRKVYKCSCGTRTMNFWNMNRHVKSMAANKREGEHNWVVFEAYLSVCGRIIEKEDLQYMLNDVPSTSLDGNENETNSCIVQNDSSYSSSSTSQPVCAYIPIKHMNNKWITITSEKVKNIFNPYKKANERLDPYVHSLKLLIINEQGPVIQNIKTAVSMQKGPDDSEIDSSLKFLMNCAKCWVNRYCREHVSVLNGRVRFHLQSFFDESILVNAGYNINFTMRENESTITNEILVILELSWKMVTDGKCSDCMGQKINALKSEITNVMNVHNGIVTDKAVEEIIQKLIIQRYLHFINIEKQSNAYSLLTGHRITILRLFKLKRDDSGNMSNSDNDMKLVMRSCGEFGSTVALHIHIYRLAAASLIACTEASCWESILAEVKESSLCHILAPLVNKLKQMNNEKIDIRKKELKQNGDIIIDKFKFPYSKWSRLVPNLASKFNAIFEVIFSTDKWKQIVDLKHDINVTMIGSQHNMNREDLLHYNFYVNINGKIIEEKELLVRDDIEIKSLEQLTALVMISLHGLGFGSTRISELFRLQQHQIYWKGGNFYYLTVSNKRKSSITTNKKTVTHKLPAGISRFLLLYDYVGRQVSSGREEFLFEKGKVNVESENKQIYPEFADLFELSTNCSCLVMRHLYTSICNFLFPGNQMDLEKGVVTTAGNVAEMSGHTRETHEQYYSSSISKEGFFDKYHYSLGADIIFDEVNNEPLGLTSESDVLHYLKVIFGLQADFLSKFQKQMVLDSCNNISKHSFCSISCGGGKSLSWVIPTIRNSLKQVRNKMSIVVVPYCFLLEHHVNNTRNLIGTCRKNIDVVPLKGTDVHENELPITLRDKESLPAILFLSLEAIRKLVEYHHLYLNELGSDNHLEKIYVDEAHTILSEMNFRPSYEALSKLATFNVPISLFSGTFQRSFVSTFLEYLFGSGDNRMYNFIIDESIFGDTLMRMEHCSSKDYLMKCCHEIIKYLRSYKNLNVHVIVSTKDEGLKVESELRTKEIDCEFICSDSKNQAEVATKWNNDLLKVLITTTLGIVGNESTKTGLVCVVGLHYNLPSIVQAYGRIRFKRRTKYSKCSIFTAMNNGAILIRAKNDDRLKLDSLIGTGIVSEMHRVMYNNSMTVQSVYDWLNKDQGCRMVSLSHRLGYRISKCKICDICTDSCVRMSSRAREVDLYSSKAMKNDALQVLSRLKMKCICCNKRECNGSCVASRRSNGLTCFHCLGNHYASNCDKGYRSILDRKACFSCWAYNYDQDCVHIHTVCSADGGIKERLRALIQYDYLEKKKKGNNALSFNSHLSGIYASKDTFFKFLHIYKDWK